MKNAAVFGGIFPATWGCLVIERWIMHNMSTSCPVGNFPKGFYIGFLKHFCFRGLATRQSHTCLHEASMFAKPSGFLITQAEKMSP